MLQQIIAWCFLNVVWSYTFMTWGAYKDNISYLYEFWFIFLHFYLKNFEFMYRERALINNRLVPHGCGMMLCYRWWDWWLINHISVNSCLFPFISISKTLYSCSKERSKHMIAWCFLNVAWFCIFINWGTYEENISYFHEFPSVSLHFYLKNIEFISWRKLPIDNGLALHWCGVFSWFYKLRGL